MPLTQVVPAPLEVRPADAPPFVLRDGVRVVTGAEAEAVALGVLVASWVGRAHGYPVAVVADDDGSPGAVLLRLTRDRADLGLPPDAAPDADLDRDAYRLEITEDRVSLTALAGPGLLAAAVTVLQASEVVDGVHRAPAGVVVDRPRFAWRGLSLDVARRFLPVRDVQRVVDLLASYKLNVLHLHLTDDQGWRLELASRPELTRRSGGTQVGGGAGGFYTAHDYAELVRYAAARHITVVPEIDVPGHVNAALHAYPELTRSGQAPPAYTGIDVGFSQLHADLPATEPFLRDVLGEVASMTPGAYLHLGGDEALTMERDEYAELVARAAAVVAGTGKTAIGWQEVATLPGAGEGLVVQYWDERSGAAEVAAAALRGAQVILSPATKVYLDMKYDENSPLGLDWAGFVEVRDSYDWEPLDVVPGVPADRLLGVEAGLWSETVRSADDVFTLLLPRLAAVAEVAWSAPHRRDWDDFAARVPGQVAAWRAAGLTWHASPQIAW